MKKDWSGQKFGKLLIIDCSINKSHGKYLWNAICDCGNHKLILPGECARGVTLSCGCLQREAARTTGLRNRKYDPIISSARNIWRNIYCDGDLDFETFLQLSANPCYYCGTLPYRTYNIGNGKTKSGARSNNQKMNGDFTYNGLDRLDSTKPHNIDNVVACCTTCNTAKLEQSYDDFISHIEKIYNHTRQYKQ